MKKFISLALVLCMCLAVLASCGTETEEGGTTTAATTTAATTTTGTEAPDVTTTTSGDNNDPSIGDDPQFNLDTANAVCINDIAGVDARVYAFEQTTEFGGPVGLIYYFSDATNNTHTAMADTIAAEGYAVVSINNKLYKIEEYANNAPWFRMNIETPGAVIISGLSYEIMVYVFDAEDTMQYYTKAETKVSGLSTANIPEREGLDITLPENLTTLTVDTNSIAAEGITAWPDGAATNLFDGNTTTTKIGGGTDGSVTVTFSLSSAATVTYYTLYTGGDTATQSGRNPSSWVLYGKVNGEYVELSSVADTETTVTGLEATNSTPYSYQVSNAQECTEYKIVFVTGSQFQLNELVLLAG